MANLDLSKTTTSIYMTDASLVTFGAVEETLSIAPHRLEVAFVTQCNPEAIHRDEHRLLLSD